MYHLVESIKVENRRFHNIEYHNKRMNQSRKQLFGCDDFLKIEEQVVIPGFVDDKIFKARVIYRSSIEQTEFLEYFPRKINSFKLIFDNNIDYFHKMVDREQINSLLSKKGDCDDIIIVKNGNLTDASSSNLLFFDKNQWYTPSTPLLKGTMRQFLLESNLIKEEKITVVDLEKYSRVLTINAMIGFCPKNAVSINQITR